MHGEKVKLSSKTLIIISIAVIIFIGILLVASNNILLQAVANVESKSTRQDMERALAVLSHEISNLNSIALDYAAWNDTYAFIQNNSTDYITANLMHSTFVNLRLNFMLFVNSTGQTVYGKALDLANETEMPVPHSLQEHLSDCNILLQHENTASSVGGIVSARVNNPDSTKNSGRR